MKTYSKALIIDDDTDLCMMLKFVVSKIIPQVTFAKSLAAGKKQLEWLKPDVVFLDNNLPDGKGLDLIKEIKNASPSAFIIFITAVDSSKAVALEYGADVFLEKPFTYASIFKALDIDPVEEAIVA